MFPFWDIVIAPLIEAADPKVVVEIGALRGDTTVRLLESLDHGAELHVIDPEPQFDPEEHERRFGGRYVFHRDPSLDVIPDLPPVDVALIDGDHNWYTVYNELRLLDNGARRAGADCRCSCSTTSCGRTGGATATTRRIASRPSSASRAGRRASNAARTRS